MNARLTTKEYDDHLKTHGSAEDELLPDSGAHQRLIGKLLYLTITRPDLAFNAQTLNQFLQQPKKSHMEVAMRIIKYIRNHPVQGVLLSSNNKGTLESYCDADWAACQHSRNSVTSFLIKLGDSLESTNYLTWQAQVTSLLSGYDILSSLMKHLSLPEYISLTTMDENT
ncbi:uncharacterized mitochondrial protein AtMg00810-like [Nicotiana sylvestris]|uniref:uncharacterized mitochondrial protein AtMg00810-like n=1 Tax=Nicotiana sylvestris TaxID=4096 RepID=UPI00388C360D